jgi:hypothetical protein
VLSHAGDPERKQQGDLASKQSKEMQPPSKPVGQVAKGKKQKAGDKKSGDKKKKISSSKKKSAAKKKKALAKKNKSAGGKKKNKSAKKSKKSDGKKNNSAKKKKSSEDKRKKSGVKAGSGRQAAGCLASNCLDLAVTYIGLLRTRVANFQKQTSRIATLKNFGINKLGKQNLFDSSLNQLITAGGGNMSNLSCGANQTNPGKLG